ncbi:hypothetical protein J7K43_02380 [Candidatus Calescamantes bacterium]|nr:hypothetical protein [Candidatus Calescamantes bacterium]
MEILNGFVGKTVVVDTDSRWIYIGTLRKVERDFLILENADAHDLNDTISTREEYIRSSRMNGVVVNRREVWIKEDKIVGVSLLEDVIP